MLENLSEMDLDLRRSGLVASDMYCRQMTHAERAATKTNAAVNGYVIPYHNMHGRPIPFYRVRLFDALPKYKQIEESQTHVYFPSSFMALAKASPYIILTEGEKKAALAVKLGFPTCALGGVDAWRSRTISVPIDTKFVDHKSKLQGKLPSHTDAVEDFGGLAVGLQELIDFVLAHNKQIIICYDSDADVGVKPSVQRAAASLAFDLRFRGIAFSHIRQIVLPIASEPTATTTNQSLEVKVGMDDFLLSKGVEQFKALIDACLAKKTAFPRHPNIRSFINQRLQRANLNRKETQQLSLGILSDLDSNGMRLINTNEAEAYYFDYRNRKLYRTSFSANQDEIFNTPFGQFLYRRYGLGSQDKRVTAWVATQFTGEDPIEEVSPHRVIARVNTSDDCVHYQISDSQYVTVSARGLEIYDNGENGILFESGQVLPLDAEKLLSAFEVQQSSHKGTLPNYWHNVLGHVRLRDKGAQRGVASLLYYMSPWLYRWRGMQLPIEMVLGESGSGKSTLYELRLAILNGETRLRNSPLELKDWHASISSSGGLHVTDNVQLVDRSLRQRLSDEICRIITEPNPHIEMRKLYTNGELIRLPINSVFGITAIQQPFQNADLLQRSIILELDKAASMEDGTGIITYDSDWRAHQLDHFGGREGWVAHHLLVLQRFFTLVEAEWKPKYLAKHRLINFEQSMMLMAKVFGMDANWIPNYLTSTIEKNLEESDWTFEGLKVFVETQSQFYKDGFTANTIADWATGHEDFDQCEMLKTPRRLGRYIQTHKAMLQGSLHIREAGKRGNRVCYKLERPIKK